MTRNPSRKFLLTGALLTTALLTVALFASLSSPLLAEGPGAYELRVYHAAPGKIDALHARFRNHTIELFEKHGMKVVGFWVPTNKEGTEGDGSDRLLYILGYDDHATRDTAWKAFVNDPEWKKVYAESTADGRLVEKVESTMMSPTDYWSP